MTHDRSQIQSFGRQNKSGKRGTIDGDKVGDVAQKSFRVNRSVGVAVGSFGTTDSFWMNFPWLGESTSAA